MSTFSSYQPAYQNIQSKREIEREQRHTGRATVSSVNDSVRSRVCLLCLQETVTAVKGVTRGILYVFSPPPPYIKIYFLHFPSFQSCQHTYISVFTLHHTQQPADTRSRSPFIHSFTQCFLDSIKFFVTFSPCNFNHWSLCFGMDSLYSSSPSICVLSLLKWVKIGYRWKKLKNDGKGTQCRCHVL